MGIPGNSRESTVFLEILTRIFDNSENFPKIAIFLNSDTIQYIYVRSKADDMARQEHGTETKK